MGSAYFTFTVTAGMFSRGQLRRAIKQYAWAKGYPLNVEEDKGLLASLYKFTFEVPDADIQRVYAELNNYLTELKGVSNE